MIVKLFIRAACIAVVGAWGLVREVKGQSNSICSSSFIETFDLPYADCAPAGSGPTQACHSRYSYASPLSTFNIFDPAQWLEPSRPFALGAPASTPGGRGSRTVRPTPLDAGNNWLWVYPWFRGCEGITGTIPNGQTGVYPLGAEATTVWSKRVTGAAGYGGRFSVSLYLPAPSANHALVQTIILSANGTPVGSFSPTGANVPANRRVELAFDVPDNLAATGALELKLEAARENWCCQYIQQCPLLPIEPFAVDNIAYKSTGIHPKLATPNILDQDVCSSNQSTFQVDLAVLNPTPNVIYNWYNAQDPTTIIHSGSNYSTTVLNTTNFYVGAVPSSGNLACPSDWKTVVVTVNPIVTPSVSFPSTIVRGNLLELTIPGINGYTYTWSWGDGQSSVGTNVSHTYSALGDYTVILTIADRRFSTPCITSLVFQTKVVDALCQVLLNSSSLSSVHVQKSNVIGNYFFISDACNITRTAFDCFTGQGQSQQVVAASAVSMSERLMLPDVAYNVSAGDIEANPFLSGAGRLRPEATYAYSTAVDPAYTKSFEVGRFSMTPFNWQVSARHRLPAWQRAGLATRFSPNGEATEEQDILGVMSTVKLGYKAQALPYLTAKNAGYAQVLFEGFENMVAGGALQGEDRFVISAADNATLERQWAHSGAQSLLLQTGSDATLTLPAFAAREFGRPMQLKLWVRVSEGATPAKALSKTTVATAGLGMVARWAAGQETPVNVVAQSGEWMLCEATAPALPYGAGAPATYSPQFACTGAGTRRVWVDDVRLQPWDAQMTCYVYHPVTLKLLASFDDQHFGLYYQYNAEGKLVRKQVETERGLKTIQETQYNTPAP